MDRQPPHSLQSRDVAEADPAFVSRAREASVWLVSYPKSGNTWLRFVVFYLVNKRAPLNSVELDSFMNSHWVGPLIEGPMFKKSHACWKSLRALMGDGPKVVYLVRHPLDVMQSGLNYALLTGEIPAGDASARDLWVQSYIAAGGNPAWRKSSIAAGSWIENVRSWREAPKREVLFLRYEDCLADPALSASRIAQLLQIGLDGQLLSDCLRETSFEALKHFEEQEVVRAIETGRPQGRFSKKKRAPALRAGRRFFSSGRAGAYRQVFSPTEIEAAWAVFRDAAAPLGYDV